MHLAVAMVIEVLVPGVDEGGGMSWLSKVDAAKPHAIHLFNRVIIAWWKLLGGKWSSGVKDKSGKKKNLENIHSITYT